MKGGIAKQSTFFVLADLKSLLADLKSLKNTEWDGPIISCVREILHTFCNAQSWKQFSFLATDVKTHQRSMKINYGEEKRYETALYFTCL